MKMSLLCLYIFTVISFISCDKKEQELPNGFNIWSQEDLNKYAHLLEETTIYDDDIVFNNDDQYDLSMFKNVKEIKYLNVRTQSQLDAFVNLKKVGGLSLNEAKEFSIRNIEEITGLLSMRGVETLNAPSLKRISLFYTGSELQVLGDFSNVTEIDRFWIQFDPLERIEDFSSLARVTDFKFHSYNLEIVDGAFGSLSSVGKFDLQIFEDNFDLNWVSKIAEFREFKLRGPIDKLTVCQYIYPIRNNASEEFDVFVSEELRVFLGLGALESLSPPLIESLCE